MQARPSHWTAHTRLSRAEAEAAEEAEEAEEAEAPGMLVYVAVEYSRRCRAALPRNTTHHRCCRCCRCCRRLRLLLLLCWRGGRSSSRSWRHHPGHAASDRTTNAGDSTASGSSSTASGSSTGTRRGTAGKTSETRNTSRGTGCGSSCSSCSRSSGSLGWRRCRSIESHVRTLGAWRRRASAR